jgi:hypothetical protein
MNEYLGSYPIIPSTLCFSIQMEIVFMCLICNWFSSDIHRPISALYLITAMCRLQSERKFVTLNVMKAYRGMEVWFHSVLTSKLEEVNDQLQVRAALLPGKISAVI